MSDSQRENQIALLKKLQIIAPASMLVIAALVYGLWDNELGPLVAGVIALLAIPDFFVFKFLIHNLENNTR